MAYLILFLIQNIYVNSHTKNSIQKKEMNVKVKTTKVSIEKGKIFNVSEIYYDSLGYEIKQINYTSDNKVSTIITKEYDKNGYLLSMENYNKSLLTSKKTTYQNIVNKKGQLLSSIVNSSDDNIKLFENYTYNDDQSYQIITKEEKEIITIKYYNSNSKLIKLINLKSNIQVIIKYDKNNGIVEQNEFRQGKPTKTIIYKNLYDEKNRIFSVETTNTILEYEYDIHNNVIKETHKNKNGIITLTKYFIYQYH